MNGLYALESRSGSIVSLIPKDKLLPFRVVSFHVKEIAQAFFSGLASVFREAYKRFQSLKNRVRQLNTPIPEKSLLDQLQEIPEEFQDKYLLITDFITESKKKLTQEQIEGLIDKAASRGKHDYVFIPVAFSGEASDHKMLITFEPKSNYVYFFEPDKDAMFARFIEKSSKNTMLDDFKNMVIARTFVKQNEESNRIQPLNRNDEVYTPTDKNQSNHEIVKYIKAKLGAK